MPQRPFTRETIAMFLAILLTAVPAAAQQPPIHLSSPSGKLQATILSDVDGDHHLAWSLQLNGKPLVLPSPSASILGPYDLGQEIGPTILGAPPSYL